MLHGNAHDDRVVEVDTYLPISGASMSYYCTPMSLFLSSLRLAGCMFHPLVSSPRMSLPLLVSSSVSGPSIDRNITGWITIIIIVVVGPNFCPGGIYTESEFWFLGITVVI